MKLNQKTAASITPPESGRKYVSDEGTPHLQLCITHAGTRSWYWYGRVFGKPQRIFLGRFPNMGVERARAESKKITGQIADGKIPQSSLKRQPPEMTLGQLFDWWLENVSKKRKRTWDEDRRRFARVFSEWRHTPLSNINRAMVIELHNKVSEERGIYAGNKAIELLKTLYRCAMEVHSWPHKSPVAGVSKTKVNSRKRFLQPEELPAFFKALASLQTRPRQFFMLCLLTGARRGNVLSMEWVEINWHAAVWEIPASKFKTDEDKVVILVPQAIEILRKIKETNESRYVFPSTASIAGHYSWPKEAWQRLLVKSGLKNLRIHDLRRTLGSWQSTLGSSLHLIGESLGHGSTEATKVYARLQTKAVRESVEKATEAILRAGEVEKNS